MEKKILLLGLLLSHGMHGYQLNEMLQQNPATPISLKKSNAYKLLNDMEADGWVSYTEEQEGNRHIWHRNFRGWSGLIFCIYSPRMKPSLFWQVAWKLCEKNSQNLTRLILKFDKAIWLRNICTSFMHARSHG